MTPTSESPTAPAPMPEPASAAIELCTRLPGDGALAVAGDDAAAYLNTQLSSDLRQLDPHRSLLTSYSDPRGRLLTIARLLPRGPDAMTLVMGSDIIDTVAAQLRKYALRAAVRIDDLRSDHACLGIAGADTADRLIAIVGELPAGANAQVLTADGLALARLPGGTPRWSVVGSVEAIAELAERLGAQAPEHGEPAWRRLEIEAGLPRIRAATAGRFVAQMVNLDCLGAIDFRKGCFPGQEVIARTRYLGRIKRRMFILRAATGPEPTPGGSVYRADGDDQPVGEIVDAAPGMVAGSVSLAVMRLEALDGDLRLGAPDGPAVEVRRPPYPLTEPE